MNMERKWLVYCHTNKINGKKYIGITCQKPERRWQNGYGYKTKYFYNAIQKYGWDNFEHEILRENLSFDDAKQLEIKYIAELHTCIYDSECNGYNATFGGDGCLGYKHSEETKLKFKNRVMSEETKRKISKTVSKTNKGRVVSEETKKKISKSETGKIVSDETRKKISDAQKGRKLSDEWKQNISKHHLENPRYNCECIFQIDKETNEIIQMYPSISEAKRQTNINNISACLNGRQKTAGGFKWKYVNTESRLKEKFANTH